MYEIYMQKREAVGSLPYTLCINHFLRTQDFCIWQGKYYLHKGADIFPFDKAAFKFVPRRVPSVREQANLKTT